MNHTENLPAQEVVGATPPDFDAIRHFDENGVEYWLARELYPLLGYSRWQRFLPVVTKAKEACVSSNINVEDHFTNMGKMVGLGSGATRELEDIALSRYACYLIVQNGDPTKPVIAAGQTYFAIQTRRQEIEDQEAFVELNDDQKRLLLRREVAEHNKRLVDAAHDAGVIDAMDYAIFQNYGYKGPCRKTCQPPRKASSSLNAKNGSGLRRKTVTRKSGNAISPSPALGYAKRALVQRPAHIAI